MTNIPNHIQTALFISLSYASKHKTSPASTMTLYSRLLLIIHLEDVYTEIQMDMDLPPSVKVTSEKYKMETVNHKNTPFLVAIS